MQKVISIAAVMLVALLGSFLGSSSAFAQETPNPATSEAARRAELNAALEAANRVGLSGPADVTLIDQARLKVPAGYFFVPKAEGMRVLRALGNQIAEGPFVGIVIGTGPKDAWIVVIRYIKEGYVKDDDAKNWNADQLLKNIKEGVDEGNKDRLERGFPEVEVLGWIQPPTYDAATHRLLWSMLSKDKGQADNVAKGINYNTYALGRDGYFSLNLLSNTDRIASEKAIAHELLADLSYNSGKRYEDFNASTDRIAEYGLAALIGGVVAKKLGLFAIVIAFVLKFAKAIAVAVAVFFGGVAKFFRRKPKGDAGGVGGDAGGGVA